MKEPPKDYEDLGPWLRSQHEWHSRKARRKAIWGWVWIAVVYLTAGLLFFGVLEKANADMLTTVHYPSLDFQEVTDGC